MPFDPFFSSQNKKHYIEREGVNELYQKLQDMSVKERLALFESWKERGPSIIECIVKRKFGFEHQRRRRGRIHRKSAQNINKAVEELHQGKRDKVAIFKGYNTAP